VKAFQLLLLPLLLLARRRETKSSLTPISIQQEHSSKQPHKFIISVWPFPNNIKRETLFIHLSILFSAQTQTTHKITTQHRAAAAMSKQSEKKEARKNLLCSPSNLPSRDFVEQQQHCSCGRELEIKALLSSSQNGKLLTLHNNAVPRVVQKKRGLNETKNL